MRLNLRVNGYFLFPYPRVLPIIGSCPYTGIPPQAIRRTVRRQFSALTPGKHFTITSSLQNRSTKSKCRPSTSVSLQSPDYSEGTGSSEKELVATHSIIMDLI